MNSLKESRAVLEVRAWKAELDAEFAHLPVREAVRKRLADAAKVAERLGFQYTPAVQPKITAVAETRARYTAPPVAKVAETPAKCRTGRRPTKTKAL
jgi:hypothetical protein